MRYVLAFPLFALAACSSALAPTVPTPVTAPPAATHAPAVSQPTTRVSAAPSNWQLLDQAADGVPGTGVLRAESELLAGRKPTRVVVVAVIDGGVDTAHADLRPNLWQNEKETAGNGTDDDNNGYVDDTRGWNFLGGRDGKSIDQAPLELTRQYALCNAATTRGATPPRPDCAEISARFKTKREEAIQEAAQIAEVADVAEKVYDLLRRALAPESVTVARVKALTPTTDSARAAKQIFLQLDEAGASPAAIAEAHKETQDRVKYSFDPAFDPRNIVGDDPRNVSERRYGNRDATGPDAGHGTHVAGIIGAARNNVGMDGAAALVRLMPVRAVPNGDEWDKDVANAIRYAVDNGAQIINMSFGKELSPDKAAVDDAVRYAESKGVLLVHAAGNDGEDLAKSASFPIATFQAGGRASNWIEVGASSWKGGEDLAATFSNYGKTQVDIFAPGVDILSTIPGGGYDRKQGTSMAAPVVSGVAAMLMSYFPKLTAAEVKRIIIESATKYGDTMVLKPGGKEGEKVRFGDLSATGGIINAYAAVQAAIAAERGRPIP